MSKVYEKAVEFLSLNSVYEAPQVFLFNRLLDKIKPEHREKVQKIILEDFDNYVENYKIIKEYADGRLKKTFYIHAFNLDYLTEKEQKKYNDFLAKRLNDNIEAHLSYIIFLKMERSIIKSKIEKIKGNVVPKELEAIITSHIEISNDAIQALGFKLDYMKEVNKFFNLVNKDIFKEAEHILKQLKGEV